MKRNFLNLAKCAAKIANDKKALDVVVLNIQKISAEANYVVIASAESTPQINAIRNTIMQTLKDDEGMLPLRFDGRESTSWNVLDYGGIIIHIMSPRARDFYDLDKIYDGSRKLNV